MSERENLTEETPESPEDFRKRQLTEVGGATKHNPQKRVLTEDLPEEDQPKPGLIYG
jgi:hypothetical protein